MTEMDWLNEIVCWKNQEFIQRRTAIWRFVSKGLYPFLEKNGYVVGVDVITLTTGIATVLYTNRGASCMASNLPPATLKEYGEDYKNHYYHVVSPEKWGALWSQWAVWSDFTDSRGEDRRIDIQEFCWTQLDLDESPQTQVVEELLGLGEEYQYTGKTEDIYLKEANESNEWGGFRR